MTNPGTPTFDQLRIFLAIVDTGSFAAAGRKLNRAVSVISAPSSPKRAASRKGSTGCAPR